jgi:nucleoside-diphosphate-sugar epimerase
MHPVAGKRVLVTGGAGFIGRGLVRGLTAAGARVRVLDNDSRGSLDALAREVPGALDVVRGDIRDAETVRAALRGIDAVHHLAYVNGTEFFYKHPTLVLEVAVKGMVNVIDGCLAEHVPELVLASSSEVYQQAPVVPTAEDVALVVPDVRNPRYCYGGGKILAELMAMNWGRAHLQRVIIFRPHNVYGPQMGFEHVIPQFALRMKELTDTAPAKVAAVEFPIQGDGSETRAFIYIDDFVDGLLRVIEDGEHLGIYHIGTEEEVSIRRVAELVAAEFSRPIRVVPGPLLPGSTRRRCPDVGKLRALGFTPKVPLARGIAETVAWYRAHGR